MKPTRPHKRAEEETEDFLQMHQSDHFSPFPSCTTQAPSTSVNKVLQKPTQPADGIYVTEAQGWKAWWVLSSWMSLPVPDPCQTHSCWGSASFGVPNHRCNKGPWKQWLTPRVVRKESISTCTFPWFDVGSVFLNVTSSEDPAPGSNYCSFLYFILCFKGRKTNQPIKSKYCSGKVRCDLITDSFYEL